MNSNNNQSKYSIELAFLDYQKNRIAFTQQEYATRWGWHRVTVNRAIKKWQLLGRLNIQNKESPVINEKDKDIHFHIHINISKKDI